MFNQRKHLMKHCFCQSTCCSGYNDNYRTKFIWRQAFHYITNTAINGRGHACHVHDYLRQDRIRVAAPCYAVRFPIYRA